MGIFVNGEKFPVSKSVTRYKLGNPKYYMWLGAAAVLFLNLIVHIALMLVARSEDL